VGEGGSQRTDLSQRVQGRTLFAGGMTHEEMLRWWREGARIKRTSLTEKFTFAEFRARYGDQAVPLFALDANGRLKVLTADAPEPGGAGKLISLIRAAAFKSDESGAPRPAAG
jgi:hypothetical protein